MRIDANSAHCIMLAYCALALKIPLCSFHLCSPASRRLHIFRHAIRLAVCTSSSLILRALPTILLKTGNVVAPASSSLGAAAPSESKSESKQTNRLLRSMACSTGSLLHLPNKLVHGVSPANRDPLFFAPTPRSLSHQHKRGHAAEVLQSLPTLVQECSSRCNGIFYGRRRCDRSKGHVLAAHDACIALGSKKN
jgi:hypothetical protein